MLVYGDHSRPVRAGELLLALRQRLLQAERLPPGLARHSALVASLVDAGELVQGVLDALHAREGRDVWTPGCVRLVGIPLAIAGAVKASHDSAYRHAAQLPHARVEALLRQGPRCDGWPAEVTVRMPEGYAFYALYPEAYLEAASALPRGEGPVQVVGIRSIGTGLASLVAAVAARGRVPLTVRPGGHPFARTLSLSEEAERRLLGRGRACRYAVVDEGPGLSGSSFGAVADVLEAKGVPARHIHFFPSHAGPLGPHASARHRARWERAPRHSVSFEQLFLAPGRGARSLVGWVEDLTGAPTDDVEDVGGGGWRRHLFAREAEWPPVFVQQERRKYLVRAERGVWLLKFAGVGGYGERTHRLARQLAGAGFTPPVAGLRHGFLVYPWLARAHPLHPEPGLARAVLIARVGDYLGFRARHLRVSRSGASPGRLLEMARHNAAGALGQERAQALEALVPLVPDVQRCAHPVLVDGRLQPWEWLHLPDGRLLKADAADHHAAHDLVGCQDVAWDVAGAAVELGLTGVEREALADTVARGSGVRTPGPHLRFYTACYLAFRLGLCTLAAQTTGEAWPAETERLLHAAASYARTLDALLGRL
jgi:hypothetical protein